MIALLSVAVALQGIALFSLTFWLRALQRQQTDALERDLQLANRIERAETHLVRQVLDEVLDAIMEQAKNKTRGADA